MARGNKNYFRHYNEARRDSKIMSMIDKHGKESYFHYFVIVELCASQAENQFPIDSKFKFHIRTLASELLLKRFKVLSLLESMQNEMLLKVESKDNNIEIQLPNLSKYMGRYESKCTLNVPNKKKIKESKVKEKKDIKKSENKELEQVKIESIDLIPEICRERIDASREELTDLACFGVKNCHKLFEKFPSEFIFEEINTMKEWLKENKNRKFTYLFVLNWLKRGYDIEKHGPSEFTQESHNEKVKKILGGQNE